MISNFKKILPASILFILAVVIILFVSSNSIIYTEEEYFAAYYGNTSTDIDDDDNDYRFDSIPLLRQPTPEEAEKYPQLTNLPALYITLNDNIPFSAVTKEVYTAGTYTLVYGEEGGIYDEPLSIKGRGNYSWSNPKRPYTLKFTRDAGILGMKSARKWVILGEYVDKTLLRTYLTHKLALDIGQGDTFNGDIRYVDVYLNGEYNGLYVITDSVQIHENRVDVDEATEALFEIEAIYRHDDHTYCVDMRNGSHHIMYKKPDDIPDEMRFKNLEIFQDFFDKFHQSFDKGFDEFSKYIDVESFVNWYIVNELVKNYDSAFTSSCYCYIKDGKLHMGPVWDYHTCYGNQEVATCRIPTGYHVRTSPWFSIMMDDEKFNRLVRERWTELRNDGVISHFIDQIPGLIDNMAESVDLNYKLWPAALKETGLRGGRNRSFFTFEEEVDYLVNWTSTRIDWLDSEWYISD